MKKWNLIVAASMAALAISACSDKSTKAEPEDPCKTAPLLSKSCLDGEWKMDASVAAKAAQLIAADPTMVGLHLPTEVIDYGAIFTLDFNAKTGDVKLTGTNTSSVPPEDWGTFTIPEGEASLSAVFENQLQINKTIAGSIVTDSTGEYLVLKGSLFCCGALPQIAEVYYR